MSFTKEKKATTVNHKVISVTKRNQQEEKLDVRKIKDCINWACRGLTVNHLILETKVSKLLYNTISTQQIHDNCIRESLELVSAEEPDWTYVASRLYYMDYLKVIQHKRNISISLTSSSYKKNIPNLIKERCSKDLYNKELITDVYSDRDLELASSYIDFTRDLNYDYAGMYALVNRYMYEDETPQEMYLVVALCLASVEKSKHRLKFVKEVYDLLSLNLLSLATPLLMNLRKKNANLSSCFITKMDDNSHSIFETLSSIGHISKEGGGVGVNISSIRCLGSTIRGRKNSSGGVIPWTKLINDTGLAMNQGGARAGAITVGLDAWHYDLFDFLETQKENSDIDERFKAHDIFPQIIIPDLFMERFLSKGDWIMVDPYEVKNVFGYDLVNLWGESFREAYLDIESNQDRLELVKKKRAKDVFLKIGRDWIETGLPYLFFKDTANRYSPNKDSGVILQGNLCMESFSPVSTEYTHCCNLVSIVLANVSLNQIPTISRLAVRLLDNAIELTTPPTESALKHNEYYRTIGIGYMGLADWLAKNNLNYYTGGEETKKLFEEFAYHVVYNSIELAKERGVFGAYEKSEWYKGNILGFPWEEFFESIVGKKERWESLRNNLKKYGIRHSQLFAIAPTTSSALVQGVVASVLPPYNLFFQDKNARGIVPIVPKFLKDKFYFYNSNSTMDQTKLVTFLADNIVPYIDSGISMELNFNQNLGIKPKDIFKTIVMAWKKKCKTIYYVRGITKKEKQECIACAN